MDTGRSSECRECFALGDSDKDLKIAEASIILKLVSHYNAMSKATDRTDAFIALVLSVFHVFLFCETTTRHDIVNLLKAGGRTGRLIWLIIRIMPFRRDAHSLHPYLFWLVEQMSWLCRQTSWAARTDAVTQIKHLGPEGKRPCAQKKPLLKEWVEYITLHNNHFTFLH